MLDVEPVILQELDRLAPDEAVPDRWQELAAAAREDRPWRSRRGPAALAAAAVLLSVAAPAIALSSGLRSALGFPPTRPVFARAELVVSGVVGNGFYGHWWTSPSSTGGRCSFVTTDHASVHPRPQTTSGGGGGCSIHGDAGIDEATSGHPLAVGVAISRRLPTGDPAAWVPPVVNGSVWPRLNAVRVEIRWRGGSRALRLHDHHFIGGGAYLYMPPFSRFPFVVAAYDAAGKEVAHKRLESPTLRLMRHGWKQYAREYHAWQRAHGRR